MPYVNVCVMHMPGASEKAPARAVISNLHILVKSITVINIMMFQEHFSSISSLLYYCDQMIR